MNFVTLSYTKIKDFTRFKVTKLCGVLTLGCQTIEHTAVSRGGAQSVLCPAGWLLPPIEVVKRTPTHSPFGCKPSSTTTKNDKFLFWTNTSLRKENNYWISYSIFMIVVYLKNFFIKLVYLFVIPLTSFLYTFHFIRHSCKSFYNNRHPSIVCQLHKEETHIWNSEYVSL